MYIEEDEQDHCINWSGLNSLWTVTSAPLCYVFEHSYVTNIAHARIRFNETHDR